MSNVTSLFKNRQPSENLSNDFVPENMSNQSDYLISEIKRNILQVKLKQLHLCIKSMAIRNAGINKTLVSKVIPELNHFFQPARLSFTWFEGTARRPASLLIRNIELGVSLSVATDAVPIAMMLITDFNIRDSKSTEPGFCEAIAEAVFKKIAKQAQLAVTKS